jgi:S1-C subfamily serine protease
MGKLERAGMAVLVAVAFLLCAWWSYGPPSWPFPARPQAEATVKVLRADRHGSGVHIAQGLFLTATHVVEGNDAITLKTDRGWTVGAERLWLNGDHDVALLRVAGLKGIAAAALSCRTPAIGEAVEAIGHPGDNEFVHSFGRVSSRAAKRGAWQATVVIDVTVLPGMSGGPILDESGNLVGIMVAVQTFGFALAHLGYVVPGAAICPLLARR